MKGTFLSPQHLQTQERKIIRRPPTAEQIGRKMMNEILYRPRPMFHRAGDQAVNSLFSILEGGVIDAIAIEQHLVS